MQKEDVTHYVKIQQCSHDSAKYSKAAWIPQLLWDKKWLGIVPICIKPADKGDGHMPW